MDGLAATGSTIVTATATSPRDPPPWPNGLASSAAGASRSTKRYPHLDDLVARSTPDLDIHAPMRALLHKADLCAKQADTHLDFRRPDLAYTEYLMASTIIVELVPRHKDFPTLSTSHGELFNLNRSLQKRINAQHDKFGVVRELIKDDNARSGIQPTLSLASHPNLPGSAVPLRKPLSPKPQRTTVGADAAAADVATAAASTAAGAVQSVPRKPLVGAKPHNLQGNSLRPNGTRVQGESAPADPLAERFARLRVPQASSSTSSPPSASNSRPGSSHSQSRENVLTNGSSWTDDPPSPSSSSASLPALAQSVSAPTNVGAQPRPSGPRLMPPVPSTGPPHPPKLPLENDVAASMPRQPSPTYSPARNLPSPANIEPPRSTPRSIAGAAGRPSSMPMAGSVNRSYSPDGSRGPSPRPHRALDLPQRGYLTAQELHDLLGRGADQPRILCMDVRPREQFDQGHISTQSIISIDPIALRPNISADELRETLVLSPETEQALFDRRTDFDLIVYYDQDACAPQLASLHQALVDFNYDRPLVRPPMQLSGGLDAWTVLVGEQALQTSNTVGSQGLMGSTAVRRSGRPLGRGARANDTARLEARRRARDHEPLNVEEEQAWLERVRGEGGLQARPGPAASASVLARAHPLRRAASPVADEVESSFVRSYDDFLRRYPEPSDLRESTLAPPNTIIDHPFHNFTGIQSSAGSPPPAMPFEPTSLVPKAPSRPAPSVPRRSYSGVSEKISYPARPPAYPASAAATSMAPGAELFRSRAAATISRTGLTNFGATCYMNAVLQCLSATAPLTRYFLDGGYQRAVQRNKWGSNGVLPKVYHSLMWHLWHGEYTYIAPKTFREFVSRLNKDFENAHVQHDANDFFVFLLDALHEDLNVNFARPRPANLTEAEERKREAVPPQVAARIEWNRWSQTNFSWISSLFSGQHMSRLRCPACGLQSTSYETFNSLALEIPKKGRAQLADCLKNYTREERLGAEDSWTCPGCKVPREASKRITITRAPQILVIQLKRFRSVRRGFTDKSTTFIDFPLVGLDLQPYMLGPISAADEQAAQAKFGPEIVAPLPETSPPFEYDAYGVVQHFGTLTGGHYKALVREDTRGRWVEFNDKAASSYDARRVVSEAAYLLFFVRSNVR